jgi:hypothetical protein
MVMPVITNLNNLVTQSINAQYTNATIKTKYEANSNTNAYTDADKSKLGRITANNAVNLDNLPTTYLSLAGGTITGALTVSGNLTVNGSNTTVNSTTVTTSDNTIVINNGEVGSGVTAGIAGIIVDRGTATDYQFVFVESDDSFKVGTEGSLQKVATREDAPVDTGIAYWDNTTYKFNTTRDINVDSVVVTGLVDGRDVSADGVILDTHVAATGAHGVGTIVGTSEVQTLTNKVLDDINSTVGADHVHYKVRNNTGSVIAKGTVVKATGSQPGTDYITIEPTTSTNDVAIGVVHSTIDVGTDWIGLVVNTGEITGVNTSSWEVGTILYTGTGGGFTTTKPTSGNYQASAYVLRQHNTQGTLLVEFTEPKFIASTTQAGYVQLEDGLTSTSTARALTANQGKVIDGRLSSLETNTHTHSNKAVLDATTASYTIEEQGKLSGIEANAKDDQVASEVPVTTSGNLTSTNVQLALQELQSDIDNFTTVVEW